MGSNNTSPTWPPPHGLSTVEVSRKDAIFTVHGSTRIDAPAHEVFNTLLRVKDYDEWNSFCPKVTVRTQPLPDDDGQYLFNVLQNDSVFTFSVVMNAAKPTAYTPTQLKVTDISTPRVPSDYIPQTVLDSDPSYTADLEMVYRISWKCEGGFVARGLRTERFHEVIMRGMDECEVRTWENQSGVLARTVKWMYRQTLMDKFQLWCDDLKKYCEREDKHEW